MSSILDFINNVIHPAPTKPATPPIDPNKPRPIKDPTQGIPKLVAPTNGTTNPQLKDFTPAPPEPQVTGTVDGMPIPKYAAFTFGTSNFMKDITDEYNKDPKNTYKIDPAQGKVVRDSFGNLYKLPKDENVSFKNPVGGTTYNNNISTMYNPSLGKFTEDKQTLKKTEQQKYNNIVHQAIQTKPLVGNGQFNLYRIQRTLPAPTIDELMKTENIKREGFNLPPLTTPPDYILQQAKDAKDKQIYTLVLQDKKTGNAAIATPDPDLSNYTLNNDIRSSADIVANTYSNDKLVKDKYPKNYIPGRSELASGYTESAFLGNSAPKEIQDSLKKYNVAPTPPYDIKGPEGGYFVPFPNPNFDKEMKDKGSAFNDSEFAYLDPSVYKQFTPDIPEPASVSPTLVPTQKQNILQQFGAEVGAVPAYVNSILNPPKPQQVYKPDIPIGKEQDAVVKYLTNRVSPSVGIVTRKLTKDDLPKPDSNPNPNQETIPSYQLNYDPAKGLYSPDPVQHKEGDISPNGSSFFIGNGMMATAAHVVADDREYQVTTTDGKVHNAQVLYKDPTSDIAIMKVDDAEKYPYLNMANPGTLTDKRQFLVNFGYPGAKPPLTSDRSVTMRTGKDLEKYNINAPDLGQLNPNDISELSGRVYHGQSGGPVVDVNGNVVGLNSYLEPTPTGTHNIIATINKLKEELSKGIK